MPVTLGDDARARSNARALRRLRCARRLLGLTVATVLGCSGEIATPGGFALPGAERSARAGEHGAGVPRWRPIDRGPGAPADAPGAGPRAMTDGGAARPDAPAFEPKFGIDHSQPALLPLDMRLRRLASALDIAVEDPLLDAARDARIALGGYDHAQGVLPDGLWMASRLASWVRVLRPICASPPMRERYPALPDALPELIRAAWGRSAQAEDLADFDDELTSSGVAEGERYEAICLAVFSAAEFIYQ